MKERTRENIKKAENNETAILLTQYERWGIIDMSDYISNYIAEELEITLDMVDDYNEWARENGWEEILDDDRLDEYIEYLAPSEAFRLGQFSDIHGCDNYHEFDGYGNIHSLTDKQVFSKMKGNRDFLEWYISENDLIDEDVAQDDIEDALLLVAVGY